MSGQSSVNYALPCSVLNDSVPNDSVLNHSVLNDSVFLTGGAAAGILRVPSSPHLVSS